MAEKTEKATPKKLKDARKKGQVAKIQDLPAALTFVVSIVGTLASVNYLYEQIVSFFLQMFYAVANSAEDFETKAPGYFTLAMQTILNCSLPIMIIVCFVGVLVSFLVVGPVFSFEAMKFDFKKLNPDRRDQAEIQIESACRAASNRSRRSLGAAIIIYLVIWQSLPQIISTVLMPAAGSASVVNDFLVYGGDPRRDFLSLGRVYSTWRSKRKNFAKEMKMEKFEVKQEYKDTEGDPQIKGKRREMFREIAYQEGPGAARRARAIITNPTHIAVALKYNPEEEPAPIILTMGAGVMADRIIKIGVENKIPIMRNVELARELYSKGKISEYIPEDTLPGRGRNPQMDRISGRKSRYQYGTVADE